MRFETPPVHLRLEDEHFDVADRRCPERGCRDEREQARDLRERLGRLLQRGFELATRGCEVEREGARPRLEPLEERIGVEAVAGLRRHAPRGGVRMCEQTEALELCELAPDGGRRGGHAGPHDECLRAHRLAALDVLLDDSAQDLALPLAQFDVRRLGHALCRNFR